VLEELGANDAGAVREQVVEEENTQWKHAQQGVDSSE
jgi:hypothetical protein